MRLYFHFIKARITGLLLLNLVLCAVCPASAAGAENLILNPSFENGLAKWRTFTSEKAGGDFSVAGNGHDSAYCVHIEKLCRDGGDSALDTANTEISVHPDRRYELAAYIKGAGSYVRLQVDYQTSTSMRIAASDAQIIKAGPGWQRAAVRLAPPPEAAHASIAFRIVDGPGDCYVDDVSLSDVGPRADMQIINLSNASTGRCAALLAKANSSVAGRIDAEDYFVITPQLIAWLDMTNNRGDIQGGGLMRGLWFLNGETGDAIDFQPDATNLLFPAGATTGSGHETIVQFGTIGDVSDGRTFLAANSQQLYTTASVVSKTSDDILIAVKGRLTNKSGNFDMPGDGHIDCTHTYEFNRKWQVVRCRVALEATEPVSDMKVCLTTVGSNYGATGLKYLRANCNHWIHGYEARGSSGAAAVRNFCLNTGAFRDTYIFSSGFCPAEASIPGSSKAWFGRGTRWLNQSAGNNRYVGASVSNTSDFSGRVLTMRWLPGEEGGPLACNPLVPKVQDSRVVFTDFANGTFSTSIDVQRYHADFRMTTGNPGDGPGLFLPEGTFWNFVFELGKGLNPLGPEDESH